MKRITVLCVLSASLFLFSCATAEVPDYDSMNPAEYFQKAQEASSEGGYAAALAIYNEFLKRYPDETVLAVEAEYEIAFIHYKTGKLETAEAEFSAILDRYRSPEAEILPAWPEVLSEKLLNEIRAQKQKAAQPAAAATGEE